MSLLSSVTLPSPPPLPTPTPPTPPFSPPLSPLPPPPLPYSDSIYKVDSTERITHALGQYMYTDTGLKYLDMRNNVHHGKGERGRRR